MSDFIAPYISRQEYQCQCGKCGNSLPPDLKKDENNEWPTVYMALFDRFKDLRESWGKPIPITSGYRCTKHPLKWGVHTFGLALDLAVDPTEFAKLVERDMPELRMGVYADGHVHLDVGWLIRPRWSNDLCQGARWES